ncbi:hypothetical protein EBBID32_26450 [Sphingobium indicum BiD32]|uniref:Uncharacterized protein n=1 Tax=Sphingobium indicum BiD32 TaxID=1301087 RepID=N1MNJ6_9SPHN|nr:hypothetical protein [Sphingobium indicum]CCW18294.1 hypothetical protein EBBID32_26450 [Sphingobium indicum BiD32]
MANDRPEEDADDAALAAWELGAGNTPDSAPHPKLAHLRALFAAHPDVAALTRVLDAAMNDTDDPVPVTVEVQPRLLRLLAQIETLDAAAAGRAPAPPERTVSQIVGNYLEHLLHGLVTDPTGHPHFAEVWNALCAAEGAPELAVPTGTAEPAPPQAGDGPF